MWLAGDAAITIFPDFASMAVWATHVLISRLRQPFLRATALADAHDWQLLMLLFVAMALVMQALIDGVYFC